MGQKFRVPLSGPEREAYLAKWKGLASCHRCDGEEDGPCIRIAGNGMMGPAPEWTWMARPHIGRRRKA